MMRWSLAFMFFSMLCATAHAQAFGLRMGMPIEKLDIIGAEGSYLLVNPPRPHAELTKYMVRATPKAGVCSISGSAEVDTFQKAVDIQQRLERRLIERYGTGESIEVRYTRSLVFPDAPSPLLHVITVADDDEVSLTYIFENTDICSN
jgi:hypothetical protein